MARNDIIKVVMVLEDEDQVIINKGFADDIREGQKFLLYELGEEITDPDTKESLGRIEVVKGTGVITHVQEKMATLTSDEYQYETEKIVSRHYFGETKERKIKYRKSFINPQRGDIAKKLN